MNMDGDSTDGTRLHVVRVETGRGFAPLVEAGLEAEGITSSSWQHADTGQTRFECYCNAAAAEALAERLRLCLATWADGDAWAVSVHVIAEAEWRDAWRESFTPHRVSERIIVQPPWEPFLGPSDADTVLTIDPGMGFGTGLHGTTRGCLQSLDALAAAGRAGPAIDLGSGSGILSVAAAKLGFAPVLAVEIDADAMQNAEANMRINGVVDAVERRVCGLEAIDATGGYAVVLANILAHVLITHVHQIAGHVAPGGVLVLSGILADEPQERDVITTYTAAGFTVAARRPLDEWVTLELIRPGPRAS